MKIKTRVSYLFLAAILLASSLLSACQKDAVSTTVPTTIVQSATVTAEKEPPVEETETKQEYLARRLRISDVEALPIANEEMTPDELRQLVMDYFELQLSFHWVPDMDLMDYPTTYASFKKPKTIEDEYVYGGIPYQSTGTGNLYRWLEYYDEETGIFHFSKALPENGGYGEDGSVTGIKTDKDGNVTYKKYHSFMTLFNQCSVASFWGWGRVINSANFIWTSDMNVYNGFIPVGGYTYGYTDINGNEVKMETIRRFGELDVYNEDGSLKTNNGNPGFANSKGKRTAYDTKHVIADWNEKNGDEAMYQCYAQMRPGDCVVSGGHAMMIKSVKVIETPRPDGSVTLAFSEVTVLEQIEGWGIQSNMYGKGFKNQGGVNRLYNFSELQDSKYIPFTFAEYLDENDPEDKKLLDAYHKYADELSPLAKRYSKFTFTQEELEEMTGEGVEKAVVFHNLEEEKKSITYDEFAALTVGSNYPISDVFVVVYDKDGNQLVKNIFRSTSAMMREVSMTARKSTWEYDEAGNAITISHGVSELANSENTIEISLQLSTGEKLIAYKGILEK